MTLSVIIVNYNTKELLKKCVESVKDTFSEAEIIVVDNASDDKSGDMPDLESYDKILHSLGIM